MAGDLDAGWAEVTGCLAGLVSLRPVASSAGLSGDPLWPFAARLNARTAVFSASVRDLPGLDDVFWREADTLGRELSAARERAAAARLSATGQLADLARVIGVLHETRPRSKQSLARFGQAHAAALNTARASGNSILDALNARALGRPAPGRRLRPVRHTTWLGRRLGRDAMRICRDGVSARALADEMVSSATAAVVDLASELESAIGASLRALVHDTARWHAELTDLRAICAPLCPSLAPAADLPALHSLPGNLLSGRAAAAAEGPGQFSIAQALTRAAWSAVRLVNRGDTRWQRLTRANTYPRDLRTLLGGIGFVASRRDIAASCADVWPRLLDRWPASDAQRLAAASGYAPLLALLDELPPSWLRMLTHERTAAGDRLAAIDEVIASLDLVAEWLRVARTKWESVHMRGPGGLTPAVRACVGVLASRPAGEGLPTWLHADLTGLARDEPELRMPIAAPMKAGKSTLLSALLGTDIVPRRADVMTALATRFIPVAPDISARPALHMTPQLVDGHADLLDRIRAALTDEAVAGLASQPRLQQVAMRLRRGDRVAVATTHTGADDIRPVLTWLHDTVRLATVTLPAQALDLVLGWVPEVTVPVPGTPEAGRLVFIDTPGPGEAAASPLLATVVARHLAEAHGCLALVDYAQIGSVAAAAVARLLADHAALLDPAAVVIAVNRIDQRRRNGADPGTAMVRDMARDLFETPSLRIAPVIETAAAVGLAAERFLDSGDGATRTEFLHLAYPADPPDPLPADDKLKRLAVTAVQQSGLPDLRAEVFGRIRQRVPDLAVDRALARVDALQNASESELVAATRWALQHSGGPA